MTAETDRHFGPVAAIVLAGGRARRMGGGDKPLTALAGRPLLDHVLDRIRPQAAHVAINAIGDVARFARWSLPVVPDTIDDYPGPLAGVLAGLDWAATISPRPRWLLSVPGDAPFLPTDRAMRTLGIRNRAEQSYNVLSPTMKANLAAYAAGVNAWLANNKAALPPEFILLQHAPETWQPVDALLWGKLMALSQITVPLGTMVSLGMMRMPSRMW